jgi:hypothetical protein
VLLELAEAAVHLLVNLARNPKVLLVALIAFLAVGIWAASQ